MDKDRGHILDFSLRFLLSTYHGINSTISIHVPLCSLSLCEIIPQSQSDVYSVLSLIIVRCVHCVEGGVQGQTSGDANNMLGSATPFA